MQPPTPITIPSVLTQALTAPIRQYLTKFEWLSWDENTVLGDYTADVLDGSISVDVANDVRRSFSASVDNTSGLYIPNGARVNMKVKVRVKRGIQTPAGVYWWTRGVFVFSDPSGNHSGAEKITDLEGVDKWSLHNGDLGGTLEETTVIAIGTNVAEAIREVAEVGGETKFAFDLTDVVTPYTVSREIGDTRADLMKELALIVSWELFYDIEGYLRFRPMLDPTQKQVVADLSVGGEYRKCYIGGKYNPAWSEIKNYWKVTGDSDSDTGEIFEGIASLDNPDSPMNTSDPPIGIGKKIDTSIRDKNLTTDASCEERAWFELRQNLAEIDRGSHTITPLPFLNEGDCVQLEDVSNGIPDAKYEIQAFTEPLDGLSAMQIETWQVVNIFEIIAFDDFQAGLGTWVQLSDGGVDVYGFAGNNCLRKASGSDPNGGYRVLTKTVTDFEFTSYTRRDDAGNGVNSYSVTDSSGNGYGVALDYSGNSLMLQKRTAWSAAVLGTDAVTPILTDWYTLRLIKVASNFTAEVHAGKVTTFTTPLAYIDVVDSSYVSFSRESVNGGYPFYTDDITVRKLL